MLRTGLVSIEINRNESKYLENITSLTISNYGDSELIVTINDVSRPIPPFSNEIGVPFGSFNLPGDGTVTDKITIDFTFTGGAGKAILDYRKLIQC